MKKMVASRSTNEELVTSWMRAYGLFQGINSNDRTAIVSKYFSLIFDVTDNYENPTSEQLENMFMQFLTEFHATVPRKWLSATSKLLWCSFPDSVVIYDAFVERALVILQGIVSYLASMPRIQESSAIKTAHDVELNVNFYMNYQSMVLAIMAEHQNQLTNLRKLHSETYPHDIRIIDKLLWMLGNPNQEFVLNGRACNV